MVPFNGAIPEDYLLVVLKSYFDGGNKADSSQYNTLALASVSGTKSQWHPFEVRWKKNLRKHRADYLHMTDAIGKNGIYDGWCDKMRDDFITDCVDVALDFIARTQKKDDPGRFGLFPCVVSFDLKDFVAVANSDPDHPNNVDQMCLRQVVSSVIWWARAKAMCEECSFYFDQGEPFLGHLIQIMNSRKAMRDAPALAMITHKGDADMRRTPALQMADLYAWCVCHRNDTQTPDWLKKLLTEDYYLEHFDKDSMISGKIPEAKTTFKSWNTPRRAHTK